MTRFLEETCCCGSYIVAQCETQKETNEAIRTFREAHKVCRDKVEITVPAPIDTREPVSA